MKIDNSLKDFMVNSMRNITKEARYTLKGKKIVRLKDGMEGNISKEVAFGKAYQIEWENGKSQILGRSTILDKRRYKIIETDVK